MALSASLKLLKNLQLNPFSLSSISPACGALALSQNIQQLLGLQQTRNKWADWRMLRDVKKRQCLVEHAPVRCRMKALRKNDILPQEIQEIADKEIHAMPRNSSIVSINKRCVLTSRPRGVLKRWRLSRIVWRHLADYNKLSSVQRAMW
nr:EOG090X0MNX [Lepidurus arcticus]